MLWLKSKRNDANDKPKLYQVVHLRHLWETQDGRGQRRRLLVNGFRKRHQIYHELDEQTGYRNSLSIQNRSPKVDEATRQIFLSYQIAYHTHNSLRAQRLDLYLSMTSEQGQLRLKIIIYSIINCNILQLRLFSHIPSCTSANTISRVFAEVEPPAVTKFSEISSEYLQNILFWEPLDSRLLLRQFMSSSHKCKCYIIAPYYPSLVAIDLETKDIWVRIYCYFRPQFYCLQ